MSDLQSKFTELESQLRQLTEEKDRVEIMIRRTEGAMLMLRELINEDEEVAAIAEGEEIKQSANGRRKAPFKEEGANKP